jgi:hypothetical protein
MIDGKYYDFILDSGADVFLVQSYVKDGTVNSNNHMVSRVTSDVFKTT